MQFAITKYDLNFLNLIMFSTTLYFRYGDVVATGTLGRLISMPIILLGLIICTTLISGMCSMYLSYVVTRNQGTLFSKKVQNSHVIHWF